MKLLSILFLSFSLFLVLTVSGCIDCCKTTIIDGVEKIECKSLHDDCPAGWYTCDCSKVN